MVISYGNRIKWKYSHSNPSPMVKNIGQTIKTPPKEIYAATFYKIIIYNCSIEQNRNNFERCRFLLLTFYSKFIKFIISTCFNFYSKIVNSKLLCLSVKKFCATSTAN